MDEFWSEAPNVEYVAGLTFVRMIELIALDERMNTEESRRWGGILAASYHDPSLLDKLEQPTEVDLDKLPTMMRPTKDT